MAVNIHLTLSALALVSFAQAQPPAAPIRTKIQILPAQAKPVAIIEGGGAVISHQGDKIALIRENSLFVHDLRTGAEFLVSTPGISRMNLFRALEFSADGNQLLVGGIEGGFTRDFPTRILEVPVDDEALARIDRWNRQEQGAKTSEDWEAFGIKRLTTDRDLAGTPLQAQQLGAARAKAQKSFDFHGIYPPPYVRQILAAVYSGAATRPLVSAGVNNLSMKEEVWIGPAIAIEGKLIGMSAAGDRVFVITKDERQQAHFISVSSTTGKKDGRLELENAEVIGRVVGTDEFVIRSTVRQLESVLLDGPGAGTAARVRSLPAVPAREGAGDARIEFVQVSLKGSTMVCWVDGSRFFPQRWIEVYSLPTSDRR